MDFSLLINNTIIDDVQHGAKEETILFPYLILIIIVAVCSLLEFYILIFSQKLDIIAAAELHLAVISIRFFDHSSHRYGTSHCMHPINPSQAPKRVSCVHLLN